ncbi:30S ribosomal protein S6 [Patescibacteria group bacterium]|nr:30S ribosomal protein S6 [Patescibacteria group bacterium]
MQKLYELVVILHPQLSKDEQDAIHAKVDGLLGKGKKQTDEMGLVQLAHPIGKARLTQAHIDSHYCELDAATVTAIKNELSITKGVVRHVFFAMAANEKFHSFAEVNKKFEPKPLVEGEKKPEMLVRKGYFNKEEHNEEITWKAVKLLKFYITRFGDMKPRRFMSNSVSQQKKVRQAILRARELGVLAYTN